MGGVGGGGTFLFAVPTKLRVVYMWMRTAKPLAASCAAEARTGICTTGAVVSPLKHPHIALAHRFPSKRESIPTTIHGRLE